MTMQTIDYFQNLLAHTYHSDQQVRQQAEKELDQLSYQPGFVETLISFVCQGTDAVARQAASIYMKNMIMKRWNRSESLMTEQDRIIVKTHFMTLLSASTYQVQHQLLPCLMVILRNDLEQWPEFVGLVDACLASLEGNVMFAGCLAAQCAVYARYYSCDEPKNSMDMLSVLFPRLLDIAKKSFSSNDPVNSMVLKTVLKTFKRIIQATIPESIKGCIVEWVTVMLRLVEGNVDYSNNQFNSNPLKWSLKTLNHLVGRCNNNSLNDNYCGREYANQFISHVATQIQNSYLMQVTLFINKNRTLSLKSRELMADFFSVTLTNKILWKGMQSHVEMLITKFIFDDLCYNEQDDLMWKEDPYEYIHCKFDPFDDSSSHTSSLICLLTDLVSARKKHCLTPTLSFIQSVLNRDSNSVNNYEIDGVLCMAGALSSILMKSPSLRNQLPQFLSSHVIPHLSSSYPFLRARACWVLEHFDNVQLSDPVGVFQKLTCCLADAELPVRVRACAAVGGLIEYEQVQGFIGDHVPQLMHQLLVLSNESDMEAASSVMEKIASLFAEQLTPFTVDLCAQLSQSFIRMITELDDDDSAEKLFAAIGMLKTISTLVVRSPPVALDHILTPLFHYCLSNAMMDVYDELFELIEIYLVSIKTVSEPMWGIYDLILQSADIDFVCEMMPSLDCYIAYGGKFSPLRLEGMVNLIKMTFDSNDDTSIVSACKLAESLLLFNNKTETLNHIVPLLMTLSLSRLNQSNATLTSSALNVAINALHYNPTLVLAWLNEQQFIKPFFECWYKNLALMSRVHDKKLICLTAMELIGYECVDSCLVFCILVDCLLSLPDAEKKKKEIEEAICNDDLEEQVEGWEEEELDDEGQDDEDELDNENNNFSDVDDDFDWDDLQEESGHFDNVNVYQMFNQFISEFRNRQSYQQCIASIDGEKINMLSTVINENINK